MGVAVNTSSNQKKNKLPDLPWSPTIISGVVFMQVNGEHSACKPGMPQ